MGDLRSAINTECERFQSHFNGIFGLNPNDREYSLGTLLKQILPTRNKPKWALFPLYIIYELLYRYSRGVDDVEKVSYAYTLVLSLVSHFIQDRSNPGMHELAAIDPAMIRSFLAHALRNDRGPGDNDELTDFKSKGLCQPFTIGPTSITFEMFLMNVAGPQPQVVKLHDVADTNSRGGKSRRRRQHRRFRSKKRGRKTLRKRRN
jgi:hypothetical protein